MENMIWMMLLGGGFCLLLAAGEVILNFVRRVPKGKRLLKALGFMEEDDGVQQ